MKPVCVRFAPSPTGYLHIGGLRTALFNWLWVKKNKGKFILRIEDTDKERFVAGAVENIIEALKWYGLDFNVGPVYQSQRLDIYKKYADQLIKKNRAYYCFCTQDRLEQVRKMQKANKQPTQYDGFCCSLGQDEVKKKLAAGEPHVVRLQVPGQGKTNFSDLIYGDIEVHNSEIDDQVLLKSDGYPTYHLANVVDDHEQGITHVIRAEEWLPSTPKHIILYQALAWQPPIFAHLPMVLGPDRSKLSKRHGAVAALEYKDLGYLPQAVLNFIVLLGWNPKTDREIFSIEELIREFDLNKVNKSSAVFNIEKLDWLNGMYLRKMPMQDLVALCRPFLEQSTNDKRLTKIVKLVQSRMKRIADIKELTTFIFTQNLNYKPEVLIPKGEDLRQTVEVLEMVYDKLSVLPDNDYQQDQSRPFLENFIKENSLSNKIVLWPLRVALTGSAQSPGVFEVIDILGKRKTLARLKQAIAKLKK